MKKICKRESLNEFIMFPQRSTNRIRTKGIDTRISAINNRGTVAFFLPYFCANFA
jgi:hypothetical protein